MSCILMPTRKKSSSSEDWLFIKISNLYITKQEHSDAYHTILPTVSHYTYQWATFPEVNNLLIVKRKICQWILTLFPSYRFILVVPNFPQDNMNINMILNYCITCFCWILCHYFPAYIGEVPSYNIL